MPPAPIDYARPNLPRSPRGRRSRWPEVYGVIALTTIFALVLPKIVERSHRPSNSTQARTHLHALTIALSKFKEDTGRYPTEAEGLNALMNRPPALTTWRGPYLPTLPTDPWQHPYIYHAPTTPSGKDFQLLSAGPDAKESTPDDITN